MFSLQELCRKNIYILPYPLGEHVLQQLGLYWKGYGSLQRIGDDHVLLQQDLIFSINEALRMAGEEGNNEVVKLLLLWEGNLHYAIIGALEGDRYDLIHKYYGQIGDCHKILPLIQDPQIFEKCHELSTSCNIRCLLEHAVKHNMLSILQKHKDQIRFHLALTQILFELACHERKNDIIRWIGYSLHIYQLETIFDVAFAHKNLSLYVLGYELLMHKVNTEAANIDLPNLLSYHLRTAAAGGLLHFMFETLKHGGYVDKAVLSAAISYKHRKVVAHFIHQVPRKTVEKLLLHAVQTRAPKKTLNLLLSSLNYSVHPITKQLVRNVVDYRSTLIVKLLLMRRKRKLNLVDAVLARLVRYSTYTDTVKFMGEFSVSPEKVIKMAARESRTFMIEMISKAVWKNHPQTMIHHLKQLADTMKPQSGKDLIIYTIHYIYQSSNLLVAEEEKNIFKLAKFYANHNSVNRFKQICEDYYTLDVDTRFKTLILECFEIAVQKNYPRIATIVDDFIRFLFYKGDITEEEISEAYSLKNAELYVDLKWLQQEEN
ncbi:pMGF505-10R [African swine fever virus]|uniref:Protein MGF 505-10R n=1 Tax=African swine fever virus (isolate Tick/Malawi/Lil 20-1/1983) TaxID=10500 RepID=50510_ASFM2|nr:RecName: Full=Protein MGF 505-10R [African swine fever virus Malawi LIL 20/1]AAA50527.1 multigene family 530 protein [African swine fever virus]WRY69308.1 pMGF505-10R [African swine fever virus]